MAKNNVGRFELDAKRSNRDVSIHLRAMEILRQAPAGAFMTMAEAVKRAKSELAKEEETHMWHRMGISNPRVIGL